MAVVHGGPQLRSLQSAWVHTQDIQVEVAHSNAHRYGHGEAYEAEQHAVAVDEPRGPLGAQILEDLYAYDRSDSHIGCARTL